jgi:hypothetical protein
VTEVVDLPADTFPFTVEYVNADNPDEMLATTTVSGPGVLRVPGFAATGVKVMVRVIYPDGQVEECWPEGREG